jgi:hypothetical protein
VNGLEKISAGSAAEHVRVYIYIHETHRSIMVWNWDEKSEDYIEGYIAGAGNYVYFLSCGWMADIVDNVLIYYCEEE